MKSKLFKVLPVMVALLLISAPALAEGGAAGGGAGDGKGLIGLGAGLAMGLAVFGAGQGQGRAASSALDGMARNPQASGDIRTAMLLALAFPESLVLFSLVISFLLIQAL